jgi:hypothetical protein
LDPIERTGVVEDTNDRPLGGLSRDVLSALIEATAEGEGLTRDEAMAVVESANETAEDRFWEDRPEHFEAELDGILEELANRGFLYEADGELRITDRDVLD